MQKVLNQSTDVENGLKMSPKSDVVRAAGFIIFRRVPPHNIVEYLLMQTSYGQNHWTPPKGMFVF